MPRILGHDIMNNKLNPKASILTPSEVKAWKLDVELVLTWRYRWKEKSLRIIDIIKHGGRCESRINYFLHAKQKE